MLAAFQHPDLALSLIHFPISACPVLREIVVLHEMIPHSQDSSIALGYSLLPCLYLRLPAQPTQDSA